MKTMQKFSVFFLCLAVLCALMTLPAFAETEPIECVIRNEYYLETDFDMTLLESLDELAASGTEAFSIDVRDLRLAECYEIVIYRGFEETVHGAIYILDGAYCYLNYVNLGNQHFDADGYFSYRSGEVMLTRADIYRGGIESISKGQYEAGQVLGLTKREVFFKVVLLQVIKRIIPPMSNEIITLIKDTSLANTIAVYELIYEAKEFMVVRGLIWPLFVAGAFYLIFVGVLTIVFGRIEKKLDYFKA